MQSFEERAPSNRQTSHAIYLLILSCVVWTPKVCAQNEWSNWRGPNYNGSSDSARPPVIWNPEKNIEWKVALEGSGSSTPVVWLNQVFILTALKTERVENVPAKSAVQASREETERRGRPQIRGAIRDEGLGSQEGSNPGNQPPPSERGRGPERLNGRGGGRMSNPPPQNIYEFKITSYDLNTGNKLWQSTIAEEVPHEGGHSTNTFASASPITDGARIYIFWGSRGVFCLDMQGKKLWNVDLGQQTTRAGFGEGSSAALAESALVVPWDHEGESFIAALDTRTGDLKWKTSREERTTWSTPLIVSEGERTQVVTNGTRVRSY
ncbi:MAG: PQQ-binding-like beta-propeller repeat protein, partial [Planctomycetes bacterium]|nr:PQQ-binding-like beta-propeller repeat protein [Planctomycetota bacterium]